MNLFRLGPGSVQSKVISIIAFASLFLSPLTTVKAFGTGEVTIPDAVWRCRRSCRKTNKQRHSRRIMLRTSLGIRLRPRKGRSCGIPCSLSRQIVFHARGSSVSHSRLRLGCTESAGGASIPHGYAALKPLVRTFPCEPTASAILATLSELGDSTMRSRSCLPELRFTCLISTSSFLHSRLILVPVRPSRENLVTSSAGTFALAQSTRQSS
jgi:hypothetical protein